MKNIFGIIMSFTLIQVGIVKAQEITMDLGGQNHSGVYNTKPVMIFNKVRCKTNLGVNVGNLILKDNLIYIHGGKGNHGDSFPQNNTLDFSNNILDFSIQTDSDSIKLGNPLIININIKNISNKEIYLPNEFNFTSNLLPNGQSKNISGLNINFNIEPVNNFQSIFIEDLVYHKTQNFRLIKPNETWIVKYDLHYDIGLINSLPDSNPPAIMVNNYYSIESTLTNSEKNIADKTIVIGKIISNKIKIYMY